MVNQKRQSVINGAIILSIAVIVVKLIGVIYKIPLTYLIGATGRGYFNSAYEIYTPVYAISMAGLPIAVARLVSENVALHRYSDARMIFKVSIRLFFIIGIIGTAILFIIAYPYAKYVAGLRNLPAILAIAPSVFFCCIMSAYRGYFEGLRNMRPTAVSQIFEAIAKLIIGLGIAYSIVSVGLSQYHAGAEALANAKEMGLSILPSIIVFGQKVKDLADANSVIYPLTAAGAILGVTSGTVMGTLYLAVLNKWKSDGITRIEIVNSPRPMPSKFILKRLVFTALPMVISALILNITNIIDTVTIQTRLAHAISIDPLIIKNMYAGSLAMAKILDKDLVKYLWGVYGASLDFKNLIPTITVSLGVSALPALSAAWAVKDKKSAKSTVETVLRITMLISLPAGIGIGVLAEPILTLIYGRASSIDLIPIATPIVSIYGYATALIAVSTPVTNMLQAIGRADIPLKALVIGASAKIMCNYIIIGTPKYNIKGAPFGSILCYAIIVCFNLFFLLKISKVRLNISSVFIKPLICSALSGFSAWASYGLLTKLLSFGSQTVSMKYVALAFFVAVAVAVLVFALSILLFKGIAKEDILGIPKGEKIAKTLEKYGLLG